MGPEEIDIALDELETRLDRLRSLYEQYFLGIEKIEPGVARKDVDRRFWLLRRVQIRNTARRFRLQVLIQRYNTFQQHWARICREIENGTYTRHLLKAKKMLGAEPKTWAAKKRLGYFRRREEGGVGETRADGNGEDAQATGEDLAAMLDGHTDFAAEAAVAASEALAAPNAREVDSVRPHAPSRMPRAEGPAAGPDRPAPIEQQVSRRRGGLETLDLDLDDDLGLSGSSPPPPPVARPAAPVRVGAPAAPKAAALPLPQKRPTLAQAPEPSALPGPRPPRIPVAETAAPARPATVAQPVPGARPAGPQAPAPARPGLPADAAPARPVSAPQPAALARRAASQPAAPARPAPAVPRADSHGISDTRLRQIHGELAAAKRQLNQADAVSLEALSKSLRESEKRIQAQHPGRSVDFHVIVKDGKPIVKPIVRK